MNTFFKRLLSIGFWIVLLAVFTSSGSSVSTEDSNANFTEGNYNLKVSGACSETLEGTIDFKSKIENVSDGTLATLELYLMTSDDSLNHSMGFLISQKNMKDGIVAGTYEVREKVAGLLNNFEGVFGFANMDAIGERPFFAYKGKIVIAYIDDSTVRGFLSVNLKQLDGEALNVSGNFTALKK